MQKNNNNSTNINNIYKFTTYYYPYKEGDKEKNIKLMGVKNMNNTLTDYYKYLCGKHRKHNTIRNYYNNTKRFLQHTHNQINNETIQQWKIWANNHYKKTNTLNSNINAINNYLQYMKMPKELLLKTYPPDDSNEYSLTETEYQQILIHSRQDTINALILQLLWHLIRPDEINNIKIKHRDHDILYLDDTKTGNNHIIMNTELQKLWDKYLMIRPIPQPTYQEYLFINPEYRWQGQKYKKTLWIRNRIERLGYTARINKKVKPYTIKRTGITLRLDKNSQYFMGDPQLVRMMARHRKLETTMKYNRKTDDDIRKYHMSLNDIEPEKPSIDREGKKYRLVVDNVFPEDLNKITWDEDEHDGNCVSFSFSIFFSFVNSEVNYLNNLFQIVHNSTQYETTFFHQNENDLNSIRISAEFFNCDWCRWRGWNKNLLVR